MRTLRQLSQDLIGFIEGQDHGICILIAERDHLPWVYAALQDIDLTSPHVFLSFPQAFVSADDYARIVADGCLTVARERAGDAGLTPPVPTDAAAAACVRAALELTRDTILPRRTSSPRLVPVLVPLTSTSRCRCPAAAPARGSPAAQAALLGSHASPHRSF